MIAVPTRHGKAQLPLLSRRRCCLALCGLALLGVPLLAFVTARPPELGLTGLGLASVAIGPLDLTGVGSGGIEHADWLQVLHRIGFGLQAEVEVVNPSLLLPVAVAPGEVGLQYAGLLVAVSTPADVWVLPFGSASLPLSFAVDNILTIDTQTASAASEALAANLPLQLQVRFDARARALPRRRARGQLCPRGAALPRGALPPGGGGGRKPAQRGRLCGRGGLGRLREHGVPGGAGGKRLLHEPLERRANRRGASRELRPVARHPPGDLSER